VSTPIHQEISFPASPDRVYSALTDSRQFGELSGAPAEISPTAGGPFSLFGGAVTGRNVELQPGKRVIQAWRAGDWEDGAYSIVHFELSAAGSGTRLVFDHTGFPEGEEEHLAAGWHTNYWDPMQKYFAR
jgi:activator of HSP90 ATPase